MSSKRSPAFKKCLDEVRGIEGLLEQERFDEARAILMRARGVMRSERRTSPWLVWQLAIVQDRSGDPVAALDFIREAVAIDPACPHFLHSYEVILNRIRGALCADDRDISEPEVPGLYRALQEECEADEDCHLAMARHHLAHARTEAALKLVDALLVLNPSNAAPWEVKARILEAVGDPSAAATARAEAAARKAPPGALPTPTQQGAEG